MINLCKLESWRIQENIFHTCHPQNCFGMSIHHCHHNYQHCQQFPVYHSRKLQRNCCEFCSVVFSYSGKRSVLEHQDVIACWHIVFGIKSFPTKSWSFFWKKYLFSTQDFGKCHVFIVKIQTRTRCRNLFFLRLCMRCSLLGPAFVLYCLARTFIELLLDLW